MVFGLVVAGRDLPCRACLRHAGATATRWGSSRMVWLCFRFPLGFRGAGELMLRRGVVVSCATVCRWCLKFGQAYVGRLCRRRPVAGDVAFRRGLRQDQRRVAVPVAGRRPARPRPRHPCPVPAERQRRQAFHGQAREEAALRPTGADHRQTQELRRRPQQGPVYRPHGPCCTSFPRNHAGARGWVTGVSGRPLAPLGR